MSTVKNTYIVTGANGFLGNNIIRKLITKSENEIRKFQKQADFLRVCGSRRRKKETRAAGLRPHGNKRRYKRNSGNVQNGFARFQIQGFRQERHADCRHDSRKPFGHTSERNRAFDKAVSVCQRKRQAGRHSA